MDDSSRINIIREQGEFFDAVPLKESEEELVKKQIKNNEPVITVPKDPTLKTE